MNGLNLIAKDAPMPIYEYACEKCRQRIERIQKVSDPPCQKCPHCGGPLPETADLLSSHSVQGIPDSTSTTTLKRARPRPRERKGTGRKEKAEKRPNPSPSRSPARSKRRQSRPMKIVVRTPNWLGDALMAFPALTALRRHFPDDEIRSSPRMESAISIPDRKRRRARSTGVRRPGDPASGGRPPS